MILNFKQMDSTTYDEVVRQHHRLKGHEFEQTLEDMKDREAWHAAVHEVTKSRTGLSDGTTTTTYISISLSFTSLIIFEIHSFFFLIHKIDHFKMRYSHSFLLLIFN